MYRNVKFKCCRFLLETNDRKEIGPKLSHKADFGAACGSCAGRHLNLDDDASSLRRTDEVREERGGGGGGGILALK